MYRKMQIKEEDEEEGEAQTVKQNVLGLFNEGEGVAGRSEAQQCSLVCLLVAVFRRS